MISVGSEMTKHGLKFSTRDQPNRFFLFWYILLAIYTIVQGIGISFSISDVVRAEFMVYRFSFCLFIVSMEISIAL